VTGNGHASRPVLVIEQDYPLRGDGLVGRLLAARGLPKRTVRAWEEPLAGLDLDAHAAIIALGGTQHAWDERTDPFLADERELLRQAHDRGMPVLGICLGAQVLARALGAEVGLAETPERGLHEVELLPASADDPVLGRVRHAPPQVYQWHLDVFDLPAGATHLACSAAAAVQAFRLGSSWALQFHPEVDEPLVTSWFASFPDACEEAGVDEAAVRAEFARREAAPFDTFAAGAIAGFLDVVTSTVDGAERERA
jgi:GMP synthase (glutamine-hydrolysing)